MPDKIKIQCSRCRMTSRETVAKLREGHQMQCPNCARLITFSADSDDLHVRRAMKEARRIRNGLVYEAAPN